MIVLFFYLLNVRDLFTFCLKSDFCYNVWNEWTLLNLNLTWHDIHKAYKRARPNQFIVYKHSILLHKMYNSYCPQMDWIELNFNQTSTSRQTHFNTIKSNRFNVGNNLLASRLSILNLKIPLIDLNMSLASFKVKYKENFLLNAPQ